MKRILFIEDDQLLNRGICMGLEREGYELTAGFSIADAKNNLAKKKFDLLLLDANLPDGDGFALCRELRRRESAEAAGRKSAIILLTARGMECDMVGGLDAGADDYIVKPVSLRVLTARIQALLRRSGSAGTLYRMGPFEFDFEGAGFRKNGVLLKLSIREQKLLAYLVAHANLALPRGKILEHLWADSRDSVEENAVAVVIRRLREKLEDDPAHPAYIKNVYGAGYMWSEEEA